MSSTYIRFVIRTKVNLYVKYLDVKFEIYILKVNLNEKFYFRFYLMRISGLTTTHKQNRFNRFLMQTKSGSRSTFSKNLEIVIVFVKYLLNQIVETTII